MCILFFQTKINPKPGEYAIILINNRDEEFKRPTLESHFWQEAPSVIGGRDAFPGKEGGTWLGMSKMGKIGVLLNVLQPAGEENAQAKGRGGLVADYLKENKSSLDYLNSIYEEKHLYNNFNLVTLEAKQPFGSYVTGHYSNLTDEPPEYLSPGIHGIGNCHLQTPWNKINYGKKLFAEICSKFPTTNNKNILIQHLLNLLSDDTKNFPDPQLQKQGKGKSESTLQALSALCVKIPSISYGTRTNTIILVDAEGKVDYIERTMKEPINAFDPQFITIQHQFTIQ